uniref:Reverse transcriptase domain-containing protein n=1 Tax=Fagus sylvatica TaxID=28930 RepID=A0A2N9H0K3_FAGSY
MGGKRNFRIESKRFDLSLNGTGSKQVQISESGRKHVRNIYLGLAGAKWIGQCVEENIVREKDQAFIRTCGENGKTYVSRRCSNDYGRYLEFTECGRGGSRGIVVIPEGRKQSGWRGFGKELQLLLLPDGKNGKENIVREKDQAFIRTCRENGKTYVSRRCSNDYGRYLEFTECGRGGSRGIVVIPEGRKQSGWRGFGKELQLLLLPDGKNGNGLQQVPRQNRSVGDGVETPRYNGELGNRGIATYAGVVGIRKSMKMLDSGPVVPPVSGIGPRFHPELPSSLGLHRWVGFLLLTIFGKEGFSLLTGAVCGCGRLVCLLVWYKGKSEFWSYLEGCPSLPHVVLMAREKLLNFFWGGAVGEKWVPKVNPVVHNGPMGDTHSVGSTARPTFEIGGPSGYMDVRPEIGPVLTPHQAETQLPNRAAIQKQDSDRDELTPQMGWFFQLGRWPPAVASRVFSTTVAVRGRCSTTGKDTGTHWFSTRFHWIRAGSGADVRTRMLVQPIAMMKAFGELVGASYEGYEEEVITLLQKIELRRPQSEGQSSKLASEEGKGNDAIIMNLNIVSWNVRGLNDKDKRLHMRNLIRMWKAVWDQMEATGGILLMWDKKGCREVREVFFEEELSGLLSWWDAPCCIGGDFNVVQFPSEKLGLMSFNSTMHEFNDFISECGLLDIPLEGGLFTWSNNRDVLAMSKIDRFLFSPTWADHFGLVNQRRLPRLLSDHFPIRLDCGRIVGGKSPFRFENMWLKVEGFVDWVRGWWASYSFPGSPSHILSIFGGKKSFILKLEKNERTRLISDLETNIYLAEICWRQKSWVKWLKEGDKNTKYFHSVANSHRRHNSIRHLSMNGVLFTDQDPIKVEVSGFYRQLYIEDTTCRPSLDGLSFSSISPKEAAWLERSFEEEEICKVVSNMNGHKAPGPDGFPMTFYHACWPILRGGVLAVFSEFYEYGLFVRSLNATFLSLILKKANAVEVKDFRPISLVGSVYKILAKVLANQLSVVLAAVISPSQNAFIQGRQITDWMLVANKCLDSRLKVGHPGVICKLDVEKAYDHVNWNFLLYLVGKMWFFSESGVRWIYYCISTALSRMMNKAVEGGFLSSFQHTFLISSFYSLGLRLFLGLKINFNKSEMAPVGNVPELGMCMLRWGMGPRPGSRTDIWCGQCSLKDGFPELHRLARNKEALVRDHLQYHNESVSWDFNFTRYAQDWELEAVASFLELLSSSSVKGYGEDRLCWRGSSKEGFQVRTYYKYLLPAAGIVVPWKRIWKTNAPPHVAFFVWVAALGHILTTDNLRRRNVIVLDWCCMCKENGGVFDLLACWGNSCHSIRIRKVWDMVPPCVFWCIWWERNSRSFEGKERNLMEVKGMASSLALSKDSKDVEKAHDQSQPESGIQPDLFEENFKELKKWVDVKSSKYGTLLVLRERRSGRLGTALKALNDIIQDDGEPPKKKLYELKLSLLDEIGWSHLATYERQWMHVRFPAIACHFSKSALFQIRCLVLNK